MSWAKRNLYFLISGILAIALLGLAGWYCYSSIQSNSANWDKLNQDYSQLANYTSKTPNAGNDKVNNIDAAREETKEARDRLAAAEKYFLPVPGIPNTNRLDDRAIAFAVRDTVAELRAGAAEHNVIVPLDFAFSFSLQEQKTVYDPNSLAQLSQELGEVRFICNTLFNCRVANLDSIERAATTDDVNVNPGTTGTSDYVSSTAVTNGNIVVSPYEVTFHCFTTELGAVLSAFANRSHTVIVKTLAIQPEDLLGMEGGGMQQPNQYGINPRNGLPVVIDEKKLKVTLALDLVKILPQPGR